MSAIFRRILGRIDQSIGVGLEEVYVYRLLDPNALITLPCPPAVEVTRFGSAEGSRHCGGQVKDPQKQFSCCYTASLAGKLVHSSWVQTFGSHSILEAGRHVDVASGEFWIYECQTISLARGFGIYPYVLSVIARDHFRAGMRKGVIYTTRRNLPSQRGILKAGFHQHETLRSIRIGRNFWPI